MIIARIAILRSPALWASPAFLAVAVLTLATDRHAWTGEWRWALDSVNAATIILGPLAAGTAAVGGLTWASRDRADVVTASGRAQRHMLAGVGGVAAWTLACQLAATVAAIAMTWSRGTPGLPNPWIAIPPLAFLTAWISIGMLAGRLLAHPFTPPLVAFLGFALTMVVSDDPWRALTRSGGATGSLVGLDYKLQVSVGQTVFWIMLTAVALLLAARMTSGGSLWPPGPLVLCAVVAMATTATVTAAGGPERFAVDPTPPLTCAGTTPEICLAPDYAREVDALADLVHPMFALLAEAGVQVPDRLEQGAALRHAVLPPEVGMISVIEHGTTSYNIANDLINSYLGCDIDRQFDESWVAYDSAEPLRWLLLDAAGAPEAADVAAELPASFVEASRETHVSWAREAVTEMRACRPAPPPTHASADAPAATNAS